MPYSDIMKFDLDAATTGAADLMAALAAHFDAAPGHWEVAYTGTDNARVLQPKTPPVGYTQHASLRLDGSGNIHGGSDPLSGYTTGGSAAAAPSGGSSIKSPFLSTSISTGIGSTRIGVWEDLDMIHIQFFATTKNSMVKTVHIGRTWAPLRANWAADLGMQGFGVHVGAPTMGAINSLTSGSVLGDGASPQGNAILINGTWYKAGAAFAQTSFNSAVPNSPSPDFVPVVPVAIVASSVKSAVGLYCGHLLHYGYVPTNDFVAQAPRVLRNTGDMSEAWMYVNTSSSGTQLVMSHEGGASAP